MIGTFEVRVGGGQVELQTDERGDAYELFLVTPVLMFIPVGPGQLAPIHGATLRVGMNKEVGTGIAADLTEGANALKNPPGSSGIHIPGSMNEAEALARQQREFGG